MRILCKSAFYANFARISTKMLTHLSFLNLKGSPPLPSPPNGISHLIAKSSSWSWDNILFIISSQKLNSSLGSSHWTCYQCFILSQGSFPMLLWGFLNFVLWYYHLYQNYALVKSSLLIAKLVYPPPKGLYQVMLHVSVFNHRLT